MKTNNILPFMIVALILISGCSGLQGTPIAKTISTQSAFRANVTCNNLSLTVEPELGSGYGCQIIPEAIGTELANSDIHPEYTEVTLLNYLFTDSSYTPHIDVFPVQEYSELLPDLLHSRLADLQTLISGGTLDKEWPLLPVFKSLQMFQSQTAVIQFQNGKGIRFLTQYSQGIVPINNQELFYAFQGLTSDAQLWVSAILPISSPILMADGKNPPGDQSMEDFANNYKTYLITTSEELNQQSPAVFSPTITSLDKLINSISVQP